MWEEGGRGGGGECWAGINSWDTRESQSPTPDTNQLSPLILHCSEEGGEAGGSIIIRAELVSHCHTHPWFMVLTPML